MRGFGLTGWFCVNVGLVMVAAVFENKIRERTMPQ